MGFTEKSGLKYLSIMNVLGFFFPPIVFLRRIVIACGIHPVFSAAMKPLLFICNTYYFSSLLRLPTSDPGLLKAKG